MKIDNLSDFKSDLSYFRLNVTTKSNELIIGRLVNEEVENSIIENYPFPFPFKEQNFICLILDGSDIASFISLSDIKDISAASS